MKKLLLACLWCSTLHAQSYVVTEDVRVTAPIALHELNRIKVANDRIAEVFGNDGAFTVETDEKTGQLFIKPTVDKFLNITLVTENQKSIDLELIPQESGAQTLVLTLTPPFEAPNNPASIEKLADLIVGMSKGVELPGFVRAHPLKPFTAANCSVTPQATYQGSGLIGVAAEVTNTTNETLSLTETQFFSPEIAAIALKTRTLPPQHTTQLYWVKKNG